MRPWNSVGVTIMSVPCFVVTEVYLLHQPLNQSHRQPAWRRLVDLIITCLLILRTHHLTLHLTGPPAKLSLLLEHTHHKENWLRWRRMPSIKPYIQMAETPYCPIYPAYSRSLLVSCQGNESSWRSVPHPKTFLDSLGEQKWPCVNLFPLVWAYKSDRT